MQNIKRITFAQALKENNITEEELIQRKEYYTIMNPKFVASGQCHLCPYNQKDDICRIKDWGEHYYKTIDNFFVRCLLKFLPKKEKR
jgi:hypothetical protein